MSVISLISILSCVCFERTVSDERVSGANQSVPEPDEIDHSKRENFLIAGTELDEHETTGKLNLFLTHCLYSV